MAEKIFLIDDDPKIKEILAEILKDSNYEVVCAETAQRAIELIDNDRANLLLLDVKLPDGDGIEILRHSMKTQPYVPVVMISGFATIDRAVTAVKLGAYDFLEKPFDPQRLRITVRNALDKSQLEDEKRLYVEEMMTRFGIIGVSASLRKICSLIIRISKADLPVLITGENGVGKELIAHAVHELSGRKVFVPVNCAAIPRELIESELFGHKKGSFTGAVADRKGHFQIANQGTLFLDEIGDMSLDMQAKILRAIETKEISSVGSSNLNKIDVRIIAATNKELQHKILSKEFREDLYFRLRGIAIHVPPLRERREDIPILAQHFIERYCKAEKSKSALKRFSPLALDVIGKQDWHGNVRELKYFVETIALLADEEVIDHLHVLGALQHNETSLDSAHSSEALQNSTLRSFAEHIQKFEKNLIEKTLLETNGNITRAAELLQLERSTLSKKMKRFGIK
jgi:two-component system nitrogen regulation response regulator NtrX